MQSRLKDIRLLLLDVDGVLTDGSIIYDDQNIETKVFNVKDGLGIRLLLNAGIQVGVITGRASKALKNRCANLGIENLYDGIHDKVSALDTVLKKTGVKIGETAFIGDDLPDLSVLKKVGVSIAVRDAEETVRKHADIVTNAKGGDGAVREICEAILKAKGLWEDIIDSFL
ncbi:MAG: HAD hydrolase family protein [Deltaproteobacteria bacterium]|nr:HAD hydrolase family protein [Deltaproteobacteria bacterium]MBW2218707.1 HAD hydrolase family protein [Deltaproteobacteria bacterium]